MSTPIARRMLILTTALGLVGACTAGAPATLGPAELSPAPSTSPTITLPTNPAASSSIAPAVIADGRYATAAVSVTQIDARIRGDSALTDAQRNDALARFSGHTSEVFTIRFASGQFTEYEAFDGGAASVGVRATFAFSDDHTLVIQEPCCGTSIFDLTKVGTGFSLHYRTHTPLDAEDDLLGRIVYESAPFGNVP